MALLGESMSKEDVATAASRSGVSTTCATPAAARSPSFDESDDFDDDAGEDRLAAQTPESGGGRSDEGAREGAGAARTRHRQLDAALCAQEIESEPTARIRAAGGARRKLLSVARLRRQIASAARSERPQPKWDRVQTRRAEPKAPQHGEGVAEQGRTAEGEGSWAGAVSLSLRKLAKRTG